MSALSLALPATDLESLRFRVMRLADNQPGTYRMLDAGGRVLYVGKAKSLRSRLRCYFNAHYPDDKAARILHAASDIRIDPAPSEFAAALAELELIRKHRPAFNVQMNRGRRSAFLVVTDEPVPRLLATTRPELHGGRVYGPLRSPARVNDAVRVLTDLLGLRTCPADQRMHSPRQLEFFAEPRRAACPRYDFGTCSGPCAGAITPASYRLLAERAAMFCEGRSVDPIGITIERMTAASDAGNYENALAWRNRFEALEWLIAALARERSSTDALNVVYREPGHRGDARAYLILAGEIRACYPDPVTPIEREAFAAVVRRELERAPEPPGRVDLHRLHQRRLVTGWFRKHPTAWRKTTPVADGLATGSPQL